MIIIHLPPTGESIAMIDSDILCIGYPGGYGVTRIGRIIQGNLRKLEAARFQQCCKLFPSAPGTPGSGGILKTTLISSFAISTRFTNIRISSRRICQLASLRFTFNCSPIHVEAQVRACSGVISWKKRSTTSNNTLMEPYKRLAGKSTTMTSRDLSLF